MLWGMIMVVCVGCLPGSVTPWNQGRTEGNGPSGNLIGDPIGAKCFQNCNCSFTNDTSGKASVGQQDLSVRIECADNPYGLMVETDTSMVLAVTSLVVVNVPYLTEIPESLCAFANSRHFQWKGGNLETIKPRNFACFTKLLTLDLSDNNLETIDPMAFEGILELETLNLSNNIMDSIQNDTFYHIKHLLYLDLSRNTLESIPEALFGHLSKLTYLNLSYNHISALSSSAFIDQNALKTLDLSRNNISDIDGTFRVLALSNVTHLRLNNNDIRVIPVGVFDNLVSLEELDLSFNHIYQIQVGAFNYHLRSLQSLQLSYNDIKILINSSFSDLCALKGLNLSHNHINSLGGDAFASVTWYPCGKDGISTGTLTYPKGVNSSQLQLWTNMEELDLSYNNLSSIHPGTFQSPLSNLKLINLSHNRISHLPRYGVEHLQQLERIELQHNALDWLDVGTFKNERLKYINLSHNKLTKLISMVFLYLPQIEEVDLSNNHLNYIYMYIFYKTCGPDSRAINLKLDLQHNKLGSDVLWKVLSTFRHLSGTKCTLTVNLRDNLITDVLGDATEAYERHLESLDYGYFETWNYVKLDVRDNPIQCDCNTMDNVKILNEIRETFTTNFSTASNVEFWTDLVCVGPPNLKGKTLERVSKSLKACSANSSCPMGCECTKNMETSIINVNCSDVRLHSVPMVLPKGPKRVILQNIGIYFIHDGMDLVDVIELDLSHNQLNVISTEIWSKLAAIPILHLNDNELQTMPENVDRSFHIKNLTVFGNPFICDCENLWLKYWLLNHSDKIVGLKETTCGDAGFAPGDPIIDVPDREFQCVQLLQGKGSLHINAAGLTIACVLILGCVSCIVIYIFRKQLKEKIITRLHWNQLSDDVEVHSDLFISFSSQDVEWLNKELIPRLLSHTNPYTVCLQHQDWSSASLVQENLTRSMTNCRATIILLSKNYLQTEWCNPEFRTAFKSALCAESSSVYVILMGSLSVDDVDSDLQNYMKNNTYFNTSDAYIWERLFYLLPPAGGASASGHCFFQRQGMSSVDAKF